MTLPSNHRKVRAKEVRTGDGVVDFDGRISRVMQVHDNGPTVKIDLIGSTLYTPADCWMTVERWSREENLDAPEVAWSTETKPKKVTRTLPLPAQRGQRRVRGTAWVGEK